MMNIIKRNVKDENRKLLGSLVLQVLSLKAYRIYREFENKDEKEDGFMPLTILRLSLS